MSSSDASKTDWALLVAPPSYQNRMSDEDKARLALSLMDHLALTPRVFLDWFLASEDQEIKRRAGHFLSPANGTLVSLINTVWARFKKARPGVIAAIEPVVQDVLERESRAAIECRNLSIHPGDVDLEQLVSKLGSGDDGITSLIRTLMPLSYKWLLHATSSDNEYRQKLRSKKRKVAGDADGDDFDEGEAFALDGEDWHDEFPGFSRDPRLAVTFCLSSLVFVRNRSTNALPLLIGSQMTVHGASTRVCDTFSRFGVVVSRRTVDNFRVRLSANSIVRAIDAARADPRWLAVLDNVDLQVHAANQRVTNRTHMLHLTNSALLMAHSSVPQSKTSVQTYLGNRGKRAVAKPSDLRPTRDDDEYTIRSFESLVVNFLIDHAPGSAEWPDHKELKALASADRPSISPLKPEVTRTFPLGALNANEGSNKGVVLALELLRERLGMSPDEWAEHLHVMAGDYLTVRNIRSARYQRQDDHNSVERLETIMPQAQLFHFQLNAVDMVLKEHLGDSIRDPGSLSKHKDILMRTFDTSKTDYANARALIRHSLIARILQCAAQLLGFSSWASFKKWTPASYADIKALAAKIVRQFATPRAAQEAKDAGDDVFAHAILFIIDALRIADLDSAISYADAGRILIILRYLAFVFRGAGRHNYARECAEVELTWKFELTDDQRLMWAASWFVNRWGQPGRFIPTDQYLEHLNYYVKIVHMADGSGVNVENIIKRGSSCIEALRDISLAVSRFAGNSKGPRRHKESKFSHDLQVIYDLCRSKKVHILVERPDRFIPRPPSKGKRSKAKTATALPPRSAIWSLFTKGVEGWNGRWETMLRTSTHDPQLGSALPHARGRDLDVELSAEDLGLGAEDELDGELDLAVLDVEI
ncbi:hypothetical protein EXIGLDRAFT_746479 [Exidia glandulosa HHB12029]|uniref:DUF6589 domain-containing protein n=1 Tax=Exidia glandulosa HHB12029 TaxID=1314781 RepID=A0A166B820_EXIGL|nr:hypothetical protein EXIGLDRAFT_746479 [Exidia glandulosa HHB12029]